MENFTETGDLGTRKSSLKKNSDKYKTAIEDQLEAIKGNAMQWGKMVLIVGGTLFVTYKIVRLLTSKDAKYLEKEDGTRHPVPVYSERKYSIFDTIKEQIALFLIAIAKEKLMKYIQELDLGGQGKDIKKK